MEWMANENKENLFKENFICAMEMNGRGNGLNKWKLTKKEK